MPSLRARSFAIPQAMIVEEAAMKRKYGYYRIEDPRDFSYRVKARPTFATRKLWRASWVGDQLDTPHCVGFAWAGWLACEPLVQFLDPHGIYEVAQHFDEWVGNDYDGTSVRAGAKVLRSLGFCAEFRWATTVDEMINAVLTHGPMVVGTRWYEGMSNPSPEAGLIRPVGILEGQHAYLVRGVDTIKQLFRVRNSWSRQWGKGGDAFVSFIDMETLLLEDGEACIATELRPVN